MGTAIDWFGLGGAKQEAEVSDRLEPGVEA
jgi:hypothetical protein